MPDVLHSVTVTQDVLHGVAVMPDVLHSVTLTQDKVHGVTVMYDVLHCVKVRQGALHPCLLTRGMPWWTKSLCVRKKSHFLELTLQYGKQLCLLRVLFVCKTSKHGSAAAIL